MSKKNENTKTQYDHLHEVLSNYWQSYGGIKSFFSSPYLHMTIVISVFMWPVWTQEGWWDVVINILPSVVGFSLGGYAIFTAFGNEDFKYAISGVLNKEGEKSKNKVEYSPFIQANASFLHFIIMQLVALILALLAQARFYNSLPETIKCMAEDALTIKGVFLVEWLTKLLWFFEFSLFVYSLSLAFAATFAIFRMALWFDDSVTIQKNMPIDKGEEKTDR